MTKFQSFDKKLRSKPFDKLLHIQINDHEYELEIKSDDNVSTVLKRMISQEYLKQQELEGVYSLGEQINQNCKISQLEDKATKKGIKTIGIKIKKKESALKGSGENRSPMKKQKTQGYQTAIICSVLEPVTKPKKQEIQLVVMPSQKMILMKKVLEALSLDLTSQEFSIFAKISELKQNQTLFLSFKQDISNISTQINAFSDQNKLNIEKKQSITSNICSILKSFEILKKEKQLLKDDNQKLKQERKKTINQLKQSSKKMQKNLRSPQENQKKQSEKTINQQKQTNKLQKNLGTKQFLMSYPQNECSTRIQTPLFKQILPQKDQKDFIFKQIEQFEKLKIKQFEPIFLYKGTQIHYHHISQIFDQLGHNLKNERILIMFRKSKENIISVYSRVGIVKLQPKTFCNRIGLQKKIQNGLGFIQDLKTQKKIIFKNQWEFVSYDSRFMYITECLPIWVSHDRHLHVEFKSNRAKFSWDNKDFSQLKDLLGSFEQGTQISELEIFLVKFDSQQ